MAKIAVFDSGLGSLSVIRAIQRISKSEIIYLADQENYPYGNKSRAQLSGIIERSIRTLQEKFSPDIIVVASNTPSLMLDVTTKKVMDVKPPLKHAQKNSKTKRIGILATRGAVNSSGLARHIRKNKSPKKVRFFKIDGSELVDLVESAKFISDKKYCKKIIKETLDEKLSKNNIDVITLSSTHLPFLRSLLEEQYPGISFVDPADTVAEKIVSKIKDNQARKNSLKIFATGNAKAFQTKLGRMGIRNRVSIMPSLLFDNRG